MRTLATIQITDDGEKCTTKHTLHLHSKKDVTLALIALTKIMVMACEAADMNAKLAILAALVTAGDEENNRVFSYDRNLS